MKSYTKDDDRIINYEVMGGWPIIKMNVREIIQGFGATFNEATNKWEIEETDALDVCPLKLNDDGMGYGVNEEYIIEASLFSDKDGKHYCNIFTDTELDHLDIWKKYNVFPGYTYKDGENEYWLAGIDETDDGIVFIAKNSDDVREVHTIKVEQLENILKNEKY